MSTSYFAFVWYVHAGNSRRTHSQKILTHQEKKIRYLDIFLFYYEKPRQKLANIDTETESYGRNTL